LAYPPAIQALLSADLIIVGPGSLFTSILPNLLVPDIGAAIKASRALKVFITNVATQPGETDSFNCSDHLQVLERHVGYNLFDLVVCNCRKEGTLPADVNWIENDSGVLERYQSYSADLIDVEQPWRHDSLKLAKVIMDLFYERTGPLAVHEDFMIERAR